MDTVFRCTILHSQAINRIKARSILLHR